MKKNLLMVLGVLLVCSFTACGKADETADKNSQEAVTENEDATLLTVEESRDTDNASDYDDNEVVSENYDNNKDSSEVADGAMNSEDEIAKAEREKNADFVKYNTKGTYTEIGGWYTIKVSASKDTTDIFDSYFMPLSYEILPEFNGNTAEDGYEWRVLTYLILENINSSNDGKGRQIFPCYEDYYDSAYHDASYEGEDLYQNFKVKIDENEYKCVEYSGLSDENTKWSGYVFFTKQLESVYAVMVPKGYDGMVFAMYDPAIDWPDDKCFCEISNENSVMFRLGNDNTGLCIKQPSYIEVDGDEVYRNTAHAGNIESITVAYSTGKIDYDLGNLSLDKAAGYYFADSDYKILNNNSDKIVLDDYGDGVVVVQTAITHISTPGSSMSSVGQNQGVIFDFNRNICYCAHAVTDSDFAGLYGVARPIVYEYDGSVKLSKNVHCGMNGLNIN